MMSRGELNPICSRHPPIGSPNHADTSMGLTLLLRYKFVKLGVDKCRVHLLNGWRIRTPPLVGLLAGLDYAPRQNMRGVIFLLAHLVTHITGKTEPPVCVN